MIATGVIGWHRTLPPRESQQFSRGKLMSRTPEALITAGILSIGFLAPGSAAPPADPAREIIPPNDGFAATPTAAMALGTTGGSNAIAARSVTVSNRAELVAALNYPDATPKLIYVRGTI